MSEWPLVPLRRICRFAYGDSLAVDVREGGGVPVYGSNGIVGQHDEENTSAPVIIIGRKGSHGKVQYSTKPVFAIDTTFFVDGQRASCDLRWLYYQLLSLRLEGTTNDVGVPGLSRESAHAQRVRYPPIQVQRAVGDYLDTETARIEALITKKQAMVELLARRASRLMNDLIGVEHVVDDSGVPVGVRGELGVRLGHLARVQTGITLDGQREVPAGSKEMPYLRVANVQDGSIDLSELKTVVVPPGMGARSRLRAGDVLMTEGGDPDKLGRGAVWRGKVDPCLHQNHVFAVRANPKRLDADYLALLTQTEYARRYFEVTAVKSTGIASTSTTKIAAFRVPLPPISSQRQIVSEYRQISQSAERLQSLLHHQIELLREHRQALITAAVTEELQVPGAA